MPIDEIRSFDRVNGDGGCTGATLRVNDNLIGLSALPLALATRASADAEAMNRSTSSCFESWTHSGLLLEGDDLRSNGDDTH